MRFVSVMSFGLKIFLWGVLFISFQAYAQSNITLRVMAANITSGNGQSYETAGINIFKGLKPDVVAIQEFRYGSSSASNSLRTLVDTAFGTNFYFFCQSGFNIPNGVVSRYPIIASGSWTDSLVSDRSYAWAQIDLPGTNDLYVVSVHLYSSGTATDRNTEANEVKTRIQADFPTNAWVIVGGDFNTSTRSEAAVTTFKTFLSDSPIPDDGANTPDQDTNEPRNHPYDYLLPSFSLTNRLVPVVIGSRTLTNGLVFDSAVYTPLSDVSPVTSGDSHVTGMQHMAVVKDFSIPVPAGTNTPPSITTPPQSQTVSPDDNVTFTVAANGTSPLAYQWCFNNTNVSGANADTFIINNAQFTNAGNYSVVVTNLYGSVTSSVAVLTVTNTPPSITTQPQSQIVAIGDSPVFSVTANGTAPLSYQWFFNGTNILGANTNTYTRSSVQTSDAGNYSVIITNIAGSATSSVATLTVLTTGAVVIAQWNFNSLIPDTNTGTGTIIPSIGTGTASAIGGVSASFVGGSSTDPASSGSDNSAWTTTSYPALSANNKTAGVQFNVSTAGKQNISVSWDQRVSNTGSKYVRLQYSTNGTTFIDFPTATISSTSFVSYTNSLAIFDGVNDNTNFAIRIVAEFESTATGTANANYVPANSANYATSGTIRFDMVTISGAAIIANSAPAIAATLTNATFNASQFQMLVTGSAGSNYVVQASTNLASTNWLSLFTNASPFTFTDTNINTPLKFYRAIVAP